jgi:hypothetical protein
MEILSENSKQEYPKSLIELLWLEEKKICAKRLLLPKQHSCIYLKEICKERERSKCTE